MTRQSKKPRPASKAFLKALEKSREREVGLTKTTCRDVRKPPSPMSALALKTRFLNVLGELDRVDQPVGAYVEELEDWQEEIRLRIEAAR